jgi:outer membrane usher protein
MMAPYKAGYGLTVGSGMTMTVGGTLRDANGETVPLLAGVMHPKGSQEKKIDIFTNGSGRFLVSGLTPGDWEIDMSDTPSTHFSIFVNPAAKGVIEAGDVRPH